MDSFEINKIAAALIVAVLLFMGINMAAETLFHVEPQEARAYIVEGVGGDTATEAVAVVEDTGPDFNMLLASASVDSGARAFRKCQACHTIDSGGATRTGPNLWNIVGRSVGSVAGYNYSSALSSHGGAWTYDMLNEYLLNPKTAIPGNKMSFAGVRRDNERANLIAYLRAQNDNPPALPEIAEDTPTEDIPADGE